MRELCRTKMIDESRTIRVIGLVKSGSTGGGDLGGPLQVRDCPPEMCKNAYSGEMDVLPQSSQRR